MGVEVGKSFPRGGRKPVVPSHRIDRFKFLGTKSPNKVSKLKTKKAKGSKTSKKSDEGKTLVKVNSSLKQTLVVQLSYKTLVEEMVVLGCVCQIGEFHLSLNLPGRLLGKVPITNISEAYTTSLQKLLAGEAREQNHFHLNEMFKVGQYVLTKVMGVARSPVETFKVTLSLSPHALHSDWLHTHIQVGLVMTASVKSVEDHGYVMDLGVKGVRAFLKETEAQTYGESWNDGRPLGIGQLVRCLVTKSSSSGMYTTVELSADPTRVAEVATDVSNVTIATLLPGMLFNVTVSQIIRCGLQVKFAKQQIGYVYEDHLNKPSSLLTSFKVGDVYPARILYVEPTVKFVYFTLLEGVCSFSQPASPYDRLEIGSIVSKAQVLRVNGRGVLLSLGSKHDFLKGFVSMRHLHETLKRTVEEPLTEQLQKMYPLASKHKCRILGYDYITHMYNCTMKKCLLETKFFSIQNLYAGQVVGCYVAKVEKNGISVIIGSKDSPLLGFVPAIHMSDIPLTHPEKKFLQGKGCRARVLKIDNDQVSLTLKPSLVSSTVAPLTKYETLTTGMQYEGVVVFVAPKGILVAFYNDVKGWVPLDQLSQEPVSEPAKLFFVGQVVKCYVRNINVETQRVTLSLISPDKANKGHRQKKGVGQSYTLEVTEVTSEGLKVKVIGFSKEGFIPTLHLTDNTSLAPFLLDTFRKNEVLVSAYCFSDELVPVYTLRPSVAHFFQSEEGQNIMRNGTNGLEIGMVIPCSVKVIKHSGVLVNLPVPGMKTDVWVPMSELCDRNIINEVSAGLKIHQPLLAKMVKVDIERNSYAATTKHNECWDNDLEVGVCLLKSYLSDHERILSHLRQNNEPLAQLSLGEKVDGTVTAITDFGAIVCLANNVQAVAMPYHYEGMKLKVGGVVQGMVLMVDIINNCVELTLCRSIMARINVKQDGNMPGVVPGMTLKGETMVAKPDVVVVSLKGKGRLQLVAIPTRCHLNDIIPSTILHTLGQSNKIIIKVMQDGVIIGLPKKLVLQNIKKQIMASNYLQENDPQTEQLGCSDADIGDSSKKCNSKAKTEPQNSCDLSQDTLKKSPKVIPSLTGCETTKVKKKQKQEDDNGPVPKQCKIISKEETRKRKNSECVVNGVDLSKKQKSENDVDSTTISRQKRDTKNVNNKEKKKEKQDLGCNRSLRKDLGVANVVPRTSVPPLPRLSTTSGFVWDATPDLLPVVAKAKAGAESSSEDEDVNVDKPTNKKKQRLGVAERHKLARQEEEHLREVEQRFMDADRNPQSADDFDRLVLSLPNNSMIWIKYIAFHLQATEIEKARAVADRALKTISFREEQEKLNVYIALLNLENMYGTKESLDKVLAEAIQMNDSYKVHMALLNIYAESSKIQEADRLVPILTKKFRDNKEMWVQIGTVFMKCGLLDKARNLMQRALTALDKKLHVEIISRYALLENKFGTAERAQTLMEHILTSYPKRVDVWNSYVDMLVKSGLMDIARQVLERSVVQKLQARKMKALFKKFLHFEEQYGTPEGANKVRQMALQYVEAATNTTDELDN